MLSHGQLNIVINFILILLQSYGAKIYIIFVCSKWGGELHVIAFSPPDSGKEFELHFECFA